MKKYYLFFLCICLGFNAFGQKKDISGVYFSEDGTKIEIQGNELVYTEPEEHQPIWYNDTLAICKIKQLNKYILEVSSLEDFYDIFRTMEVVPSYRDLKTDSIKIVFQFPYSLCDLRISIEANNRFFSNDSADSNCVYIPKGTEKINFSITPKKGGTIHTVYGQSYGVRYLQSLEERIDPDADCITIKLPLLDNHFFEKYLVVREYIYVEGDILHWKDMDFKKR
ncbi:MAG: hypothetical protein ILA29_04935 [Prevotella sp.]|nr:hypothetical protein [Prevotella sp.]